MDDLLLPAAYAVALLVFLALQRRGLFRATLIAVLVAFLFCWAALIALFMAAGVSPFIPAVAAMPWAALPLLPLLILLPMLGMLLRRRRQDFAPPS